jgi:hypothetical protein
MKGYYGMGIQIRNKRIRGLFPYIIAISRADINSYMTG